MRKTHSALSVFTALAFLSAFPALAGSIFFHSNFEQGETYLAHEILPGFRQIELLPNSRLEEWPINGGTGIIQGNFPEKAETFHYQRRSGSRLMDVSGISSAHPRYADIRTGDLSEWHDPGLDAEVGAVIFEQDPLFGSFSAQFPKGTKACELRKYLPHDQTRYACRFYLRFPKEIPDETPFSMSIAHFRINRLIWRRVWLHKATTQALPFLHFGRNDEVAILRQEISADTAFMVPGKPHCLEHMVRLLSENTAQWILWVDNHKVLDLHLSHSSPHPDSFTYLMLGKTGGIATASPFVVDEVAIGDERIGPIPGKPVLTVAHGSLHGSFPDDAYPYSKHAASHWQLSEGNHWLLPAYNSGKDPIHLLNVPSPTVEYLWGELNPKVTLPETLRAPTGIKPGKTYLARARHQNEFGNWGEWSVPAEYAAPSILEPEMDHPQVQNAYFARPGKAGPLRKIVMGKWYDLCVELEDHKGWDNLAFADVSLHADPENDLFNRRNRGYYVPGKSLVVNYSVAKPSRLYIKDRQGENRLFRPIGRERVLYCDNTSNQFEILPREGRARARIQIPENAPMGPWAIRAYVWNENRRISPVFSSLVMVAPAKDPGAIPKWVPLIVLLLGLAAMGFALGYRQSRGHSPPRRSGLPPKEDPQDEVGLDFDSPYDENIRKADAFIRDNFTKPISPKDVARGIAVTPNWLSTFFRKGTGKTVIQYINELRIQEATKLLLETKKTVIEISHLVGFKSIRNFNKTFQKATGKSPKQFRDDSGH